MPTAPTISQPESRPRIGIIAMSPIPDDPRVRRQGDAFWRLDGRWSGLASPAADPIERSGRL